MMLPLLSLAQVPAYVPTDGLVGWWPFNGNATDESGNGNDGVVNGATLTEDRYGIANSAYLFDGINDFIQVEDDMDTLDLLGNFTISCWIKFGSMNADAYSLIFKHYGNIDNMGTYGLVLAQSDNNPEEYYITIQATPNWSMASFPENTFPFDTSTWYHLLVTYDDVTETLTYHIDGEIFDTVNVNFDINDTDIDVLFGSTYINDANTLAYFFHGRMDDIGMWKRVLTSEEITALHLAESIDINEVESRSPISIHPNPNQGDQLFINLIAIDENVTTVSVEILDLSGKRMTSRQIATQGSHLNSVIDLQGEIAAGMYLVKINAGQKIYAQRLVIQP